MSVLLILSHKRKKKLPARLSSGIIRYRSRSVSVTKGAKMTIREKYALPPTFRQEVVQSILSCVAAGESCAVVGIGSVGKSNLLRFLQREDVRRAYLGDGWDTWLFVYVDANKMLKRSLWGMVELMLHQLMIGLTEQVADQAALKPMDDLYQKVTESKTRYLALRYLDRAVGIVGNRLGLCTVFLFDEFDDLCRTISPRGLAALRALRDDHKYRLVYVVATRLEWKCLREEISEIEAFEELVSPHTIWLGPYSGDDARCMVHRLEARHGLCLDKETIDHLLAVTGGHPGLLRAGYRVAMERPSDLRDALASSAQVQDECRRIWHSLTPQDQKALTQLATHMTIEAHQTGVLEQLRRKGLIGGAWADRTDIFALLLAQYIERQEPDIGAHIYVDQERRIVWVRGLAAKGLSPLEFKLIAYLGQRHNQVCSRDELIQHLYPDDVALEGKGVSDNRLDAVVRRIRKQIEPDPKNPQYVVTIRGHGFRLVDGGENAG
jgi:DNA-binding winged helix-turn-helix (wHTH) protein